MTPPAGRPICRMLVSRTRRRIGALSTTAPPPDADEMPQPTPNRDSTAHAATRLRSRANAAVEAAIIRQPAASARPVPHLRTRVGVDTSPGSDPMFAAPMRIPMSPAESAVSATRTGPSTAMLATTAAPTVWMAVETMTTIRVDDNSLRLHTYTIYTIVDVRATGEPSTRSTLGGEGAQHRHHARPWARDRPAE